MNSQSFEKLELNKVLMQCALHSCVEGGKQLILNSLPSSEISEVAENLKITREAEKLLYKFAVPKIEFFENSDDLLSLAEKGSVLSCGDILKLNLINRSARIAHRSIWVLPEEELPLMRAEAAKLYYDTALEEQVASAILSDTEVSDHASGKLFEIRSKIKLLNGRIRGKLNEYITGSTAAYLQDATVTMRNDRFVIPVKAEYKSKVRGFVHDRSQTGATFFIEPEYVLELNNELIALSIDEREEIERILKDFSSRFGALAEKFRTDEQVLAHIDASYAKAEYAYSIKAVKPSVNEKGYINIVKGRHPLIDKNKIVPVSVELGKDYNFLVLSGANTGGKTVTLKMTGLFCLMAACGLFIPAAEGSTVAVYDKVFCDVGDSQSIEESLSTFSSHIKNVIDIVDGATQNSLVLIDELGGGTNPDEGQAIARAITEKLLSEGCKGIITTHFTALKEFAYQAKGIENASMQFDSATLKPLYSIKIGMPGSSNAIAICRRMGLDEAVLQNALSYLSEGGREFENILRQAEQSRVAAQSIAAENEALRKELNEKVERAEREAKLLENERKKLLANAKAESRRIINERSAEAEEMLSAIEKIFKSDEVSAGDLIKARTLKNRLRDLSFGEEEEQRPSKTYKEAKKESITKGVRVYIKPMQTEGEVVNFSPAKGEAEVLSGNIRTRCRLSDLMIIDIPFEKNNKNSTENVKVVRKFISSSAPVRELNVLGMTVEEALFEVDNFIDGALTDNLEEIKVIHGVGTGKLRKAIAEHLKRNKRVESFRLGKYGEGETGVTFIRLK